MISRLAFQYRCQFSTSTRKAALMHELAQGPTLAAFLSPPKKSSQENRDSNSWLESDWKAFATKCSEAFKFATLTDQHSRR